MKKKFYFGRLTVSNETDVEVSFLFTAHANVKQAVKGFELNYFNNVEEEEDCYAVADTGITYSGVDYQEITEDEYAVMSKFLHTHKL